MMSKREFIQYTAKLIKFMADFIKYSVLIVLTITCLTTLGYSYLYSVKDQPDSDFTRFFFFNEYKMADICFMVNPFTQAAFDEYQRKKAHHEDWQHQWDNTFAWQYFNKGEDKQSVIDKLKPAFDNYGPEDHQLSFSLQMGGGAMYNQEYINFTFQFSPEHKLQDIIIIGNNVFISIMFIGEFSMPYISPMTHPFTQAIFDEFQQRKTQHKKWLGVWDNSLAWQYFAKGEDKQSVLDKLKLDKDYYRSECHKLFFDIKVGDQEKYNKEHISFEFQFSPEDTLKNIIITGGKQRYAWKSE